MVYTEYVLYQDTMCNVLVVTSRTTVEICNSISATLAINIAPSSLETVNKLLLSNIVRDLRASALRPGRSRRYW